MAAKKLHEFVRGKINTPVTAIHFSSNGQQEKTHVNIPKLSTSFDDKDLSSPIEEEELFLSIDQKLQFSSDNMDNNGSNYQSQNSSKSSPDSKPKWGAHITDVKKNIGEAYAAINTKLKDHINKPDGKTYPIDQDTLITNDKQQNPLRGSKTMSNIDRASNLEDASISVNSCNKSLDNLSAEFEPVDQSKSSADADSVDFKWLPTPKNIKKHKLKTRSSKPDGNLPPKVLESLNENYRIPVSKTVSPDDNQSNIKWPILGGLIVLVLTMVWINLQIFVGFGIGLITCFFVLLHIGGFDLKTHNHVLSLPALKDLRLPSIPHIEKENFEDHDSQTTEGSYFSGWMNLLFSYDTNKYKINHCYVVHVNLENNSQMRIRRPKSKIARRAMWNESQYQSVTFSSEIMVNLENIKIDLLPQGLVKKRLWSKKYPIYIEFPKPLEEYAIEKSNFESLNPKSNCLYLFGRTCREKEEWFRRLLYASGKVDIDLNTWNIVQKYLSRPKSSVEDSPHSVLSTRKQSNSHLDDESRKVTYYHKDEDNNEEPVVEARKWKQDTQIPNVAKYVKYMSKFMPEDLFLLTSQVMHLDIKYVTCNPEILCINAFLGRIFWDFLRGSHWVKIIRNKIQCKLKKMHLPYFIDKLTVVEIDIGKEIPVIRKFGRPYLDSRGLWCDADVAYTGGFSMIIETKINLFNLRNQVKKHSTEETSSKPGLYENNCEMSKEDDNQPQNDKGAAFVSSEEDSAESSSASEESGDENKICENFWIEDKQTQHLLNNGTQVGGGTGTSSKRIIRWVDKIARSPYFIKASDNKYVQRGMELVSNTKLMLQVEVHSICGTLALNIPPPPSDRLWYGFRPCPILKMSAKPKVGQKEISISKITDFIEKKLSLEFQKVLVLPNMDDVSIPLLINGTVGEYCSNI